MGIFSAKPSKTKFDLEQHLQSVVSKYCEGVPEEQKNKLLERITSEAGNKKYAENEDNTHRIDKVQGEKVYNLDELKYFPDWQSDKDFPQNVAYPMGSKEHEEGVSKIESLIEKFKGNDSAVAKDLSNLLEHSEIHFRVLSKWDKANGSCSFKKAEQEGRQNQIVICICDLSKTGDEVLPEILAHELGHALEFSQRLKGTETKYMDGCETTADLIGASLLANAGINDKGFSEFMGKDYRDKKALDQDTQMFYSPDGKYRQENFDLAHGIMSHAKSKDATPIEKKDNKADKIKALRGLSSTAGGANKPQPGSKDNLKGLRYVQNFSNGGR